MKNVALDHDSHSTEQVVFIGTVAKCDLLECLSQITKHGKLLSVAADETLGCKKISPVYVVAYKSTAEVSWLEKC